jgi:hypothetical protein
MHIPYNIVCHSIVSLFCDVDAMRHRNIVTILYICRKYKYCHNIVLHAIHMPTPCNIVTILLTLVYSYNILAGSLQYCDNILRPR